MSETSPVPVPVPVPVPAPLHEQTRNELVPDSPTVTEDLLVKDVSIDGMCGVY